jgi:hypothetical protein
MRLWRRGRISGEMMLFLGCKNRILYGADVVNLDAIERFVLCLGSLWKDYECCFDRRSAGLKIHGGRGGV